jgi:hypothetical protein
MHWTDVRWKALGACAFVARAMRARGILPSAGAGASLVAAGIVCLAIVSGLLAFRGWPGSAKGADDGTLALRIPAAKAEGRAAAGPRIARTTFTARRVAAARPARRAVTAPRRARARQAPRPVRGRVGAPAPRGSTPPAATPAPAAPAAPATPAAAPAAQSPAPEPVAPGPVRNVVDTTRKTVAPVTDAVPAPVQQPVDQALDTVQQTAGAVDQLVAPKAPG